ncbi:uncharacterized protein LOC114177875 [Vigna unguiculata]|uniref:1-acyl-sn-glycerol-3-phosphate acyltransferase n=1 Tax=Vigna unguiculata TaxID=3917 RepID=A0A4D6L9I3_VIGUN|nr:uncharacterized protein LOC114177875 [Vigna unguiculata]QCD85116.1 hypothetical protein DEO72_LG2g5475 [Vigna unguiculata]
MGGTMKLSLSLPLASLCKAPNFLNPPTSFLQKHNVNSLRRSTKWNPCNGKRRGIVCGLPLPVDPWAPTIDSQSIASQLFAFSLFPYIGFLYFITKSKTAPNLTLFGFYFLLAFVGATIPAGIYAKVHYGTSLSNVDWLHGGAESLLTLTNLFIVLGLREGLRKIENTQEDETSSAPKSSSEE